MLDALLTVIAVIVVLLSYLLGNFNPSIFFAKKKGHDIRKEGSGNAGTTNTFRVLGAGYAVLVLLIDVAKGALAVLIGLLIARWGGADYGFLPYACGLAVFCGHIWPAVHGFKGGKGVATALGVLLAVNPVLAACCAGVALVLLAATRIMSLSTLTAALTALPFTFLLQKDFLPWVAVLVLIIIFKHRSNILRLIRHEENKLQFKKKHEETPL